MRGIAKLLFGGAGDGGGDRLAGLLGGDEDWYRVADEARRAGEWCGSTPGRGATARASRERSVPHPVHRPARPGVPWPR